MGKTYRKAWSLSADGKLGDNIVDVVESQVKYRGLGSHCKCDWCRSRDDSYYDIVSGVSDWDY